MKKIFFIFIIGVFTFFGSKTLAKILSEDYLKDVKMVKLVNGYLINLQDLTQEQIDANQKAFFF